LERLFLANGLRFACTPPSTQAHIYQQHYFDDPTRGFQRFARALDNRLLFQGAANDGYSAKFAVKSQRAQHAVDHLVDSQRAQYASELHLLDTYRDATQKLLSMHAESASRCLLRQPRNCSGADLRFIHRLMNDASITIKPADKNLGMVLVSTDWYHAEVTRMLQDRVTYQPLLHFTSAPPGTRGRRQVLSLPKLQLDLATQLKQLSSSLSGSLKSWNPHLCDQVQHYLTSSVTLKNCAVPGMYLLIKVHKAGGLSGRPIVPSMRWLTTPASVLADHLLQEVLREAAIPHLVKDTKSFVAKLECTHMPVSDGVFVTADINSLYTNIDTNDGLEQVQAFLNLQGVSARHSQLIMKLLEFVMRNSYLQYRDGVWHQKDGTAMGTSCAPPYANIVVYMRERIVLADMQTDRQLVHLYCRFLDDVFAYMAAHAVDEFKHRMNSLHPKLRFDFVVDEKEASFLDLRIHKGTRFNATGVFDLSVHQKKMNLYLYIPYRSFHTDAMKRSFILTELMRYIRNSSSVQDYNALRSLFYQRLRDRGYPSAFITPIFNSVFYSDRPYFLWPSKQLLDCPRLAEEPPRSATLIRRINRQRAAEVNSADAEGQPATEQPLVFVVPYSPLSRLLPTRSLLSRHWSAVQDALSEPSLRPPIIAYQSAPSLMTTLVYQRARRQEQMRREANGGEGAAPASRPLRLVSSQDRPTQPGLLRFLSVRPQPALLASPPAANAGSAAPGPIVPHPAASPP